jgi:BASS family bile acid:Na+ symporter
LLDALQINFNPDSFLLFKSSAGADDVRRLALCSLVRLCGDEPSAESCIDRAFLPVLTSPLLTYLLTRLLDIDASVALGMILVASCPGGSFSNIMTWLARGHLPTSVSMTGVSTVASLVFTPLNFAFYAGLNP